MDAGSVSVIIPVYNSARTIRRAVDSVLAQTRRPEEIVVVDDGSTDNVAAALAPFGEQIRLVRKVNGGAGSARNLGIDSSRGEHVAFLDSDDYWEPTKLERQLDVFRRHSDLGLCAGRYYQQVPGEPRVAPGDDAGHLLNRVLAVSGREAFMVGTRIWTSTVLVRRQVLGRQRFDSKLQTAEDCDLWIRMALIRPVYIAAEPLATAVLEPNSLSRSEPDQDYSNMLQVVRRYRNLLGPWAFQERELWVYRRWIAAYRARRRFLPALSLVARYLCQHPFSPDMWRALVRFGLKTCLPRRPRLVSNEGRTSAVFHGSPRAELFRRHLKHG
jgi:glycosyltransferase involved in cell wall biosynthesis